MESSEWKLIECATRSELISQLKDLEKDFKILEWQFSSDRYRLCVLVKLEQKRGIIDESNGKSTVNIKSKV